MRQVKHTVFEAADGSKFLTEEECARYEAKLAKANPAAAVAGKSEAALNAAVRGEDKTLGGAVEDLARLVAQARYSRGEFKLNRSRRSHGSEAEVAGAGA